MADLTCSYCGKTTFAFHVCDQNTLKDLLTASRAEVNRLTLAFGKGCSFGERCSFGEGCKVFGRVLCRLYQMSLPNLYTIKLWQMAEGEPIFEVGCFHGNLAEAKARIAGKERREGGAAKYTAAIDALDTIAKLYN